MSERADAYRELVERSAVTFRLFERIADAWKLTREQRMRLLGIEGRTRYGNWRRDHDAVRLSVLQAERVAQVVAIANHLYSVYTGARDGAESWVHGVNTAAPFGGRPPLTLMLSGPTEALVRTREYLAGWDRR